MSYQIVISKRAETNLDSIVEYLADEWGELVKRDFLNNFKHTLQIIAANPYAFPEFSATKQIRRCFVSKQNAMYYRIKNSTIEIITIHDTRKHPNSLRL